jgi:hypothetical protein
MLSVLAFGIVLAGLARLAIPDKMSAGSRNHAGRR